MIIFRGSKCSSDAAILNKDESKMNHMFANEHLLMMIT